MSGFKSFLTFRRNTLLTTLALVLALMAVSVGTALAYVTTDKADYAPGETVTISGDGFKGNELIDITVQAPYGTETGGAKADRNGAFTWTFDLPADDSALGWYAYVAHGQKSDIIQAGTFSDHGAGSPAQCITDNNPTTSFQVEVGGTKPNGSTAGERNIIINADSGNVITSICIKSGVETFALEDPDGTPGTGDENSAVGPGKKTDPQTSAHSVEITADGTYGIDLELGDGIDGCYTVSGIGTAQVTVTVVGDCKLIRRCGVPLALYSDRHAVFKYVPGSHQSPAPTQFGRAMAELGVEQIFARSPEAKGRVERANGTFQDRLVTELRLAGARTISEANQVLWAFLTRFNKRFGVPPAQSTNAYRSPDSDLNLAGILCFKHSRKVARDNTVKYNWHTLQLLPSSERSTYVGAHVVVQERLDGKLVVCYQNQIVPTQEAPPRPGVLRTLNATRGLGSVTVENLAAGMDTNGIGGHEREGLGAMTAIGRGLAAGRLTTDRESEAVHPKAQPPRPPTP